MNAKANHLRSMKTRCLLLLGQCMIAASMTAGCSHVMQPQKTLFSRCEQQVQARLNDPESYKRRSDPETVQRVEGQPEVIAWTFNAKNSLGGYSSPVEALCFESTDGNVSTFVGNGSAETEETRRRQDFLALTNPELAARLQEIETQYQSNVSEICEPLREQFQKNGYAGECTTYFLNGSMPR
jgi:hypothetical protein